MRRLGNAAAALLSVLIGFQRRLLDSINNLIDPDVLYVIG